MRNRKTGVLMLIKFLIFEILLFVLAICMAVFVHNIIKGG